MKIPEETIRPPAFFIKPPVAPAGFRENPAVNLVKCSGIKKTGAKVKAGSYPLIYFMGCGISWIFTTRKERDICFNNLLNGTWPKLKELPGPPRKPRTNQ